MKKSLLVFSLIIFCSINAFSQKSPDPSLVKFKKTFDKEGKAVLTPIYIKKDPKAITGIHIVKKNNNRLVAENHHSIYLGSHPTYPQFNKSAEDLDKAHNEFMQQKAVWISKNQDYYNNLVKHYSSKKQEISESQLKMIKEKSILSYYHILQNQERYTIK